MKSPKILIVGGGTAGMSVAARLSQIVSKPDITIIDPSEVHYYQPLFTLVGAGIGKLSDTARSMQSLIPRGARWVRASVAEFEPQANRLQTDNGETWAYDFLVVCPGIQLDWKKVCGLENQVGRSSICSNYSVDNVEYTWDAIQKFKGGNAIFTFPNTPVKCAGAPQKIMYLAEHYWRKKKLRDQTNIYFMSAAGSIFGVKKYADTLETIVQKRGIHTQFRTLLESVDKEKKHASFKNLDSGTSEDISFDFIHVVPPMSAPDFVKNSPLANCDGWVDVDKYTLQHTAFSNIFALGDASSLPTSKTGAAIRRQAPIVVDHILALSEGRELTRRYNGYTSCPLVTGYGRLVLAEFDYDGNPAETFPFDQSKERRSMYLLKKHFLPKMYWHGMMRGRL